MSNMSNVAAILSGRAPDAPNDALVSALQDMLGRAERGELQSFIGTGFTADKMRATLWCDHHGNLYEMMGALVWLQAEYVHRNAADIG